MTETELAAIQGRLDAISSMEQTSLTRGILRDAATLVDELKRMRTAAGAAVALVERNFGTASGRDFRQLFGLAARADASEVRVDPYGLPQFKKPESISYNVEPVTLLRQVLSESLRAALARQGAEPADPEKVEAEVLGAVFLGNRRLAELFGSVPDLSR